MNIPSEKEEFPQQTVPSDSVPVDTVSTEEVKGFGSPVSEQTDDYTVVYQYKDDVTILPPSAHSYITIDEAAGDSVLLFAESTPVHYIPEAGDVLTAEMSDRLPEGLGCRVVSVAKTGQGYEVVTCPAALDEIFSVLNVDATFEETEWEAEDPESRFSLEGFGTTFEVEMANSTEGKQVMAKLTGGITYKLHIDLEKEEYDVSARVAGEFMGQTGLKVNGKHELDIFKVKTKKGSKLKKPWKMGPLVTKTVSFGGVKLETEGEIDAALGLDMSFMAEAGIVNDKPYFNGSMDGTKEQNILNHFTWEGKGEVELQIIFNCGVSFFNQKTVNLLSPAIMAETKATVDLDDFNLFKNGTDLTVAAKGEVDLLDVAHKIFGKKFSKGLAELELELKVWEKKWPLFPTFVGMDDVYTVDRNPDRLFIGKSFDLKGGLLCKYMLIRPVMMVYDGDELINVFHNSDVISHDDDKSTDFEMDIYIYDRYIKFCPGIDIEGRYYPADAFPFYMPSPVVKVTDIIKTGAYSNLADEEEDKIYTVEFDIHISIKNVEALRKWGLYSGVDGLSDKSYDVPDEDGVYSVDGCISGPKKNYSLSFGTFMTRKGQDEVSKTPLFYKSLGVGGSRTTEDADTGAAEGKMTIDWSTLKRIK